MPELPEVEVTRRRLTPALLGRTIVRVTTSRPSGCFLTPPRVLAARLTGRRVTALARHGKYLLLDLDDGSRLMLHLGMTGQLVTADAKSARLTRAALPDDSAPGRPAPFTPDRHTHLRLELDGPGPAVFFRDARRFGRVRWLAAGEREPRLERLGPDALALDDALLFAKTRGRRVAMKSLLLDQAVLAGVGNIYADEALFLAGVRPTRRAGRLTRAEAGALTRAIREVLARAIDAGGSSISDYVQPDGADGAYQLERRVYARGGEPCERCGATLRQLVLNARSSCFCPRCQR
ncbi:MAG: bifunctional DNA-formamidopyrimidine glycosylase/DNA-(apurinic or apyrimidinic site) lyase [Sorangiineae bacterium]|nr:bifunctional DNA-formamidopyrimidine glycosylase/DNA-(apurinic or apyrimidinic site) lyase [Polyangiaceae bacterium]MEB2323028.1 bifunctional DNA-formamidopyrimidine glycosylase/DNA-(apurinic or apyrimidinic site) lyase [Sorangiineae bacterium]